MKYTKDYIVDEASAAPILDDTERSGIVADHRGMVKFDGKESPGFRTVVAALKRWAKDAPGLVETRNADAGAVLSSQRWRKATELVSGIGDPGSARAVAGSGRHLADVDLRGSCNMRDRTLDMEMS